MREKVTSGLDNDASELVPGSLSLSIRTKAENEWLRREAAIGYVQLKADEIVTISSEEEYFALARQSG